MNQQVTVFDLIEHNRAGFEEANNGLSFSKERYFAGQQLSATDFASNVALKNPASVQYALTNLASIGLSLNPATKFAYLVPRDGKICLDISYMGLIKIATDSGAIRWAKAEAVYANDNFLYKGVGEKPTHECDPFGDRGGITGFYCVAKTSDGDFLCGTMSADEVNIIRGRSKAFSSGKSCPWTTDYIEMAKKTIIKRDSKTWPKSERMNQASSILNEHEGYRDEYLVNSSGPRFAHQSELTQEEAEQIAAKMVYFINNNDPDSLLDEFQKMDNDQQLDVWQYLKSDERTSCKKMMAEERQQRTINQ